MDIAIGVVLVAVVAYLIYRSKKAKGSGSGRGDGPNYPSDPK